MPTIRPVPLELKKWSERQTNNLSPVLLSNNHEYEKRIFFKYIVDRFFKKRKFQNS